MQAERHGRRVDAAGGAIEANRQHSLNEVGLEKAVLDGPTVVHQGRESEGRGIDGE